MKAAVCMMIAIGLIVSLYAGEPQQPAPKKEVKLHLVKTTDRSGEAEYNLISPEELKALQNELAMEARCFDKALNLTEKEWKKDEETSKKLFPASAINRRKVEVLGFFTDEKKADEKLARYQKRETGKPKYDKKNVRNDERSKRIAEREAERRQLEEKARQLFEAKLAEVMKPLQLQKKGEAGNPTGFAP